MSTTTRRPRFLVANIHRDVTSSHIQAWLGDIDVEHVEFRCFEAKTLAAITLRYTNDIGKAVTTLRSTKDLEEALVAPDPTPKNRDDLRNLIKDVKQPTRPSVPPAFSVSGWDDSDTEPFPGDRGHPGVMSFEANRQEVDSILRQGGYLGSTVIAFGEDDSSARPAILVRVSPGESLEIKPWVAARVARYTDLPLEAFHVRSWR
ncbi:hypothetical protein BJ508DRAFT_320010 [Ascobolus immersus RN42]|uniref:Uncharacterized protein n=1 Tax=Ascobolus immersus RN42 TaxID=1160509 RepID=A0A3N4INZ5_ASCIM|nr:hypothetical protein BJ508DRAFT_320010 [Ascobolus immersus RN42]